MSRDDHFSEEQLNALVDGELDPEERSRVYNSSSRQPELDQRICQQRKLKELVKHAYEDVRQAERSPTPPFSRNGPITRALVASLLLALGIMAGVGGHMWVEQKSFGASSFVTDQAIAESGNYLLHVTSGDQEQMRAALEQARFLLGAADEEQAAHVEIVANERGINLLRSDVTPFAREIAELQAHDVVFYACSRTIERLSEEGIEVVLVPNTRKEYTALDRVVTRMQEGWKYLKI